MNLARSALFLAAVAFLLRTCAIFAGPGQIPHYHPDANKQVRAVEQFLRGDYLVILHRHNYDGYPLFNSHLVEYLMRASDPIGEALGKFAGTAAPERTSPIPDARAIATVMLMWNAALSSAAVAIAVALGWRFGRAAGLLAGALAALSPLDIAAAHFPVNDTAAAFFGLATVYLAVRIVETGRARFYVLGAMAVAAAFSSKYNAAVAGAALALAHLQRYPGRQAAVSAEAWRRVGAGAAALAIGLVLTSPALVINPHWTIDSIRSFLSWISAYGLTKAELQMPLGERLFWSLQSNGALLLRTTGAFALAGAAVSLAMARPRKALWVIFALPAAHVLISFTAKPVEHPVHHLPAVLPLLVLGAAGMASLTTRERPLALRAAGILLAAGAIGWLATGARNELFFFSHSDTRQIAAAWAADSVPRLVKLDANRTFAQPPRTTEQTLGAVDFLTPKFHRRPRGGEFLLTRFFLEKESLPVFRNPDVEVLASASALLAPDFTLPSWQPFPSPSPNDLVFVDIPVFSRSPLVRDVHDETSFAVTAVSPRPIERAWLVLRAGTDPASVTAGFGGVSTRKLLGPGELAVVSVERPRKLRSTYEGNHFYRWTATAHFGRTRVALVTDETTLGRYYFNAGLFAEAAAAFAKSRGGETPAGPRIEHAIAGLASGSLTAAGAEALAGDLLAVANWSDDEIRRRFGIHPDWIQGLPAVALSERDFSSVIFPDDHDGEDPHGAGAPVQVPAAAPILVEPGRYLLEVAGDRWNGAVRAEMRDPCGRILRKIVLPPPDPAEPSQMSSASLDITATTAAFSLNLIPAATGKLPAGLRVNLRPDVLPTVRGRLDLLRRLLGKSVAGAPDAIEAGALVTAGDQVAQRGDRGTAVALYRQAADAEYREARERLGERPSPPPQQAVGVRFRNGIELASYRLDSVRAHPGAAVGLRMTWRIPENLSRIERLAVWVHAVDGSGRTVFQGDHALLDDLRANADDDPGGPCAPRLTVTPATAPGDYELRAGLWLPGQETGIRLLDADRAQRHGVSLGRLTVTAEEPEGTGDAP